MTSDGSHTVALPGLGITYHSHHGAVQESVHVFIRAGLHRALEAFPEGPLFIFEMGFGTGLNAWLSLQQAEEKGRSIHYTAVERYPLSEAEAVALNYASTGKEKDQFAQLHHAAWQIDVPVGTRFTLHKIKADLSTYQPVNRFHLVYYDAFAPSAQPELWTKELFEKLFEALHPGGLLTTYCSKGDVRRALQAAGFIVEKLQGPPGKREMVRAVKEAA